MKAEIVSLFKWAFAGLVVRSLGFLCIVAMIGVGCANRPNSEALIPFSGSVPVPDGAAEIYVIRRNSMISSGIKYKVLLDERHVFSIGNASALKMHCEPGVHWLGVSAFGGWLFKTHVDRIEREFEAGQQYYFEVGPGGDMVQIREMLHEEGRAAYLKSRIVGITP